jgi:hypothetical protein
MPTDQTPETTAGSAICTIPLDLGQVALCDEQDFAFLSRFKWSIHPLRNSCLATTIVGGQTFSMHQLVLLLDKTCRVNHRDRNLLNNCRSNLRPTTETLFAAARMKATGRVYSSQYKGVSWKRKERNWTATIKVGKRNTNLGTFTSEEAAARAYDAAAREAWGDFAFQNLAGEAPTMPTQNVHIADKRASSELASNDSEPRTILIANGANAVCDSADFAFLSRFRWSVEHVGGLDYAVARIVNRPVFMQHLVLMKLDLAQISHLDGNGLNNRRSNLKGPLIGVERGKDHKSAASRYKGVHKPRDYNRWQAVICIKGKAVRLGSYDTEEAAARAYDVAVRAKLGPRAFLNFPENVEEESAHC